MIIIYTLALFLCFVFLARVVDIYFIASLDKISGKLNLSSEAAGATLMAIGSSAPELFVALISALKPGEHQVIGIGSIVGSAIFNLLVIVGAAAIIKKAQLTWQPMLRDLIFYALAVVLLVWFIWDGCFEWHEVVIFLVIYLLYVIAVIYWKKIFKYSDCEIEQNNSDENGKKKKGIVNGIDRLLSLFFPNPKYFYWVFFISIVIIAALSWALVELAIVISYILNIPEIIISLTVLAIGTSIPDLFSSMIVAKQGRGDMAVSNAIGSNIFDILVGLGLPLLVVMLISGQAVSVGGEINRSAYILLGSVALLMMWLIFNKWKIGKKTGIVFIGIYVVYIISEILYL